MFSPRHLRPTNILHDWIFVVFFLRLYSDNACICELDHLHWYTCKLITFISRNHNGICEHGLVLLLGGFSLSYNPGYSPWQGQGRIYGLFLLIQTLIIQISAYPNPRSQVPPSNFMHGENEQAFLWFLVYISMAGQCTSCLSECSKRQEVR